MKTRRKIEKVEDLQKMNVSEYMKDTEGFAEKLIEKGNVVSTAWATNPSNGKSFEVEYGEMLFRISLVGNAIDEIERLR
jgi:hypothetical protein